MQIVGIEVNKFWLLMLSGGYLLVAVKLTSSIFVNQLNATNLKSSKTHFQFQFVQAYIFTLQNRNVILREVNGNTGAGSIFL